MRSSSSATAASRRSGRDGEVAIPPGAEVIDVAGKTVLPGLIDGHAHLEDFHGELYLHLGITTCVTIEIFQDGPWTLAQKRGTESGNIKGPRIWTSGQAIGGVRTETDAPDSRAVRGNITVETPEEARKAIRDKKEQGYDLIKLNEFISYDLVHAACRRGAQARAGGHRAQLGRDRVRSRPASTASSTSGRSATARSSTSNGGGNWPSSAWPATSSRSSPAPITSRKISTTSSASMVEHGVAWTPTIAKWLRPLSPSAPRFRERERQILDNPDADLPAAVRAIADCRLRQALQALHAGAARPHQDLLREGQRIHPPLRRRRRHSQRRLRSAARHGGDAAARGAGDGCRGRRAADDGDPGGDAQRRQDVQEGQGLRQRRARQGRRPLHHRRRSAARHLDDAERQDGDHGRQDASISAFPNTKIRSRHSMPIRRCRSISKFRRSMSSQAPARRC